MSTIVWDSLAHKPFIDSSYHGVADSKLDPPLVTSGEETAILTEDLQ